MTKIDTIGHTIATLASVVSELTEKTEFWRTGRTGKPIVLSRDQMETAGVEYRDFASFPRMQWKSKSSRGLMREIANQIHQDEASALAMWVESDYE
jgi:hypothetical protein